MTDIDFLREELETLEGQIELIEDYKKFKGDPEYDEFAKERWLTEWINNLSPLETSLGIRFLKKRINSLKTVIEKEEEKEVA